jgi:TolA-binding protein
MLFVIVLLAFVLTPMTSHADDDCLTPIECLEKTVATLQQEMSDLKKTLQTQQDEINQLRTRNLNASQITSGTLDAARIPNLSANKITSGTLDTARIPNLSANKITTGQITAAANVKLNGHWLSGDGDNEGVYVANNGKVGIGTTSPSTQLQVVGGDIQMNSNSAKLRVGDGTYTYIADYGNGDSDKLQLHGSSGVIFTGLGYRSFQISMIIEKRLNPFFIHISL